MSSNTLPADWLVSKPFDAEHKQLIFLAFVHSCLSRIRKKLLFPDFSELRSQQDGLSRLKTKSINLQESFPKKIVSANWINQTWNFQSEHLPDSEIQFVLDLLEFSLMQLNKPLTEADELARSIDCRIEVESVGIWPDYIREGYLFIRLGNHRRLMVFRYQKNVVFSVNACDSIGLRFVRSIDMSRFQTMLDIKGRLIREYKDLPKPAVVLMQTPSDFPVRETLIPLCAIRLDKFLSTMAA